MKVKKNKFILYAILISLLVNILHDHEITVKAASDLDWITIVDANDKQVKGDKITWNGVHHAGDVNDPRYKTMWYEMSTTEYHTYESFTSEYNRVIHKEKIFVDKEDKIIGNIKEIIYSIDRQTFLKAAEKCGITADDILNGTADIYLNPVYDRYITKNGNDISLLPENQQKYGIFGLQEMLGYQWSGETQALLPKLYNVHFKLTGVNVFDINVVYVMKSGYTSLDGAVNEAGKKIKNPVHTKHAMLGQSFSYNLPDTDDNLTLNGVNYKYSYYDYRYVDRTSGKSVNGTNYNDTFVSFDAPDVAIDHELTVYMVYEPEPTKYTVNVIAVDQSGKTLATLQEERSVVAGKTFTYTLPSDRGTITYKKKAYNCQNQYYLSYTDPGGAKKKEPSPVANLASGRKISYGMPAAKKGSKASFCIIYDAGPTPIPTPSGGPPPTPDPDIPEVIVPEAEVKHLAFTDVLTIGCIRADVRDAERFTAAAGVPTTESLYGEVTAKEYLLGYTFEKKVGKKDFQVRVKRDYILHWMTATPEEAGGGSPVTLTVPVEYTVTVTRAYGYWEITNLEYYKIDNAVLRNYALPDGSITLYPNASYYHPPEISCSHSSDPDYHILAPRESITGITLPPVDIESSGEDGTSKPNVPMQDFISEAKKAALSRTGYARVRSDSLIFGGRTVISSTEAETEAPDVNTLAIPQCTEDTNENVLYKPDQIIEATKENGTYPSAGTITYAAGVLVNPTRPARPAYTISGLNQVVIHTPVVCLPSITADNDQYVQLLSPSKDCVGLVLDPDPALSDFTVNISNTGFHSGKQGYFTRDFSRSIRDPEISYLASAGGILMNQVRFPFDVYIDIGADEDRKNDNYIRNGTWVTIGRESPRFYLPMWTREGVYTVDFRTVAINGLPFINQTQAYANTELARYTATGTIDVEVSGRIYGLMIYDITDYPFWKEAFRVPDSMDFKKDSAAYPDGTGLAAYNKNYAYTYTTGTKDQYGKDTGRNVKYTFPLVNGSHPFYKNQGILKTGYMVRFSLESIGTLFSDACMISIKPSFYFVDKDGKNRKAIDLYYTEEINGKTRYLVKAGSALDQINLKSFRTGDLYLGIPKSEQKQTAALLNQTFSQFTWQYSPMFNFSDIRLNSAFRTFVNQGYLYTVKSYASFADVLESGVTKRDISMVKQRWYGQYYLPNEVHAVAKGYDVMDYADKYGVDYDEDFWLTDGYIIVNFTIETVDPDGRHRLSYINAGNHLNNGNCSMWTMEGPPLQKSSYKGPTFSFYAGDFILYYANKRMSNDYESGAIY